MLATWGEGLLCSKAQLSVTVVLWHVQVSPCFLRFHYLFLYVSPLTPLTPFLWIPLTALTQKNCGVTSSRREKRTWSHHLTSYRSTLSPFQAPSNPQLGVVHFDKVGFKFLCCCQKSFTKAHHMFDNSCFDNDTPWRSRTGLWLSDVQWFFRIWVLVTAGVCHYKYDCNVLSF